jgi:hypothetical protein
MKRISIILLVGFVPLILRSQEAKLSLGIDMGLINNWSTMPIDEVGVFINTQDYQYNTKENFQKAFIAYESKYGARIDFTKAVYSDLICAQGNISLDANVKDCSGTDWNAYQINANLFRKIYFFNRRVYLNPSIGLGYMWYDEGSYTLGNICCGSAGGSLFKYYFEHSDTYFKSKNILLNSSMAGGFKINPRLSLTLFYNYQQGLLKMYQIDIVAWKPDDYKVYERPTDPTKLMNAQINSRGTNSHFGLGLEYNLKSYPSKKIHR